MGTKVICYAYCNVMHSGKYKNPRITNNRTMSNVKKRCFDDKSFDLQDEENLCNFIDKCGQAKKSKKAKNRVQRWLKKKKIQVGRLLLAERLRRRRLEVGDDHD